jgi:hypothetical protein
MRRTVYAAPTVYGSLGMRPHALYMRPRAVYVTPTVYGPLGAALYRGAHCNMWRRAGPGNLHRTIGGVSA